jgi:hypothetical protein
MCATLSSRKITTLACVIYPGQKKLTTNGSAKPSSFTQVRRIRSSKFENLLQSIPDWPSSPSKPPVNGLRLFAE